MVLNVLRLSNRFKVFFLRIFINFLAFTEVLKKYIRRSVMLFVLKAYEIKRTAKKATSSVGGWYGNLYKYEPKLLRCKNRTRLMQVWKKLKTKNIYLIIRALFTFEFFMTLNFFFFVLALCVSIFSLSISS